MSASPHSLWTSKEEYKALGVEIYKNNRVADLELCIARRITKAQASQDVAKVLEAYDIGNGRKAVKVEAAQEFDGVADILDFVDAPSSKGDAEIPDVDALELGAIFDEVPKAKESEPIADEDNVVDIAPEKKTVKKQKASAEPEKKASTASTELDFEAMLSDLNS
jgi:hypothetical protein